MIELDPRQEEIVRGLVEALAPVPGVRGVALGGSRARGRARPDSDIDLGVYYTDESPPRVERIREVVTAHPESVSPVVSDLYEWGPWVNGGAWLTIRGQRVDLLYRSFEQLERVIEGASRGEHELHYGQQPPFGFFSPTYLGELSIAVPLLDPSGRIAALKARVERYPEVLRGAIVQDYLWSVEFALHAFAAKFAKREDVYLTASTLGRCVHGVLQALFALNRRYPVNDKTMLAEAEAFSQCPRDLRGRVEALLASPGTARTSLEGSVERMRELFADVVTLSEGLYAPRYELDALPTVLA